jgi:hypothetical protein
MVGVYVMLLGGGASCQSCGCGTSCPECRRFTSFDLCYGIDDTGQVDVTINGNALPYTVTVPASVLTPCCTPGAPSSATFRIYSNLFSSAKNVNGCTQCYAHFAIRIIICDWGFVRYFSRPAWDCNDTGGAFSIGGVGSADYWYSDSDIQFNTDCMIAVEEWLNTFTISGTITYDPCECPP